MQLSTSRIRKPVLILLLDFPHDHARSRTFRWGEDGIAGVSDTHGFQNIGFAFWNEEECAIPIPWASEKKNIVLIDILVPF